MSKWVNSLFILLLSAVSLAAQDMAPLDKAVFYWTWEQGKQGMAEVFRIKCGPATKVYTLAVDVPNTTMASKVDGTVQASKILPSSGKYYCTMVAANKAGESLPADETMLYMIGPSGAMIYYPSGQSPVLIEPQLLKEK